MKFKNLYMPFLAFFILAVITVCMIFFVDVNLAISIQDNLNEGIKHTFSYITEIGSFPYIFTINVLLLIFLAFMVKFGKNKEYYFQLLYY